MEMAGCPQCKAYMVAGQVECAICGYDPNKPPEPEPEKQKISLMDEPEQTPLVLPSSSRGATPFAALGVLVVAVVGFLIISGSDVFGTGGGDQEAGASVNTSTTETVFSAWNNDDGGEIGSGDAELRTKFTAACRSGAPVDGASTYSRARGRHPVVVVNLSSRGPHFTTEDNPIQERLVPRQLHPARTSDTELLLCVTDVPGSGEISLPCSVSLGGPTETDVPLTDAVLAGSDVHYRLISAATGEVLWERDDIFPLDTLGDECTAERLVQWNDERLTIRDNWESVAPWAISDGAERSPDLPVDPDAEVADEAAAAAE